jgi:hypothetical protein
MELTTETIEAELTKHGMTGTLFSHRQAFIIGAEYSRRRAFDEIYERFPDVVQTMQAHFTKEEWLEFRGGKDEKAN